MEVNRRQPANIEVSYALEAETRVKFQLIVFSSGCTLLDIHSITHAIVGLEWHDQVANWVQNLKLKSS